MPALSDGSFQGLSLQLWWKRPLAHAGGDGEGPKTVVGGQVWPPLAVMWRDSRKISPGKSGPDHPALLGLKTHLFSALQCPVAGGFALSRSEETEKEKREKKERRNIDNFHLLKPSY